MDSENTPPAPCPSVVSEVPVTLPSEDAELPDSPSTRSSPSQEDVAASEEVQQVDAEHECPIHDDADACHKLGLSNGTISPKERDELTSRLLEPIEITTGHSKILPNWFYRTYYETSVTLSSRVSKDTHVKHRERQDLKITKGNAFQAVAEVILGRDLTKHRVERHLKWNKKRDPSSYISVFNALEHAKRRADFHYANSQRIGHRVSIARISTDGLVAATLSATCETTWKVYTKVVLGETVETKVSNHPVDIPIWISSHVMPKDGSSIGSKQLKKAGAEIWLSITELRGSNLKDLPQGHDRRHMIMAKGHDYEWLALGAIPESRIDKVMPWDGEDLHYSRGPNIVWSKSSPEPWIYDWDMQSWRLDPNLFALAKHRAATSSKSGAIGKMGKKRKRNGDAEVYDELKICKAPRIMDLTIIRPYYKPQAVRLSEEATRSVDS